MCYWPIINDNVKGYKRQTTSKKQSFNSFGVIVLLAVEILVFEYGVICDMPHVTVKGVFLRFHFFFLNNLLQPVFFSLDKRPNVYRCPAFD